MSDSHQPVIVSILVAARNEEANIERCLKSLYALDYPVNQMDICIGDDDSTDNTADIIKSYIQDKPQFRYIKVEAAPGALKGKAKVLAQLSKQAKGQYFFFCDADIAVKPTWIKAMLKPFKPGTGVVIGLTRMKKSRTLADLLSLEWLFALTMMKICSLFKIPVTGLGNNMAVTREAYEAVGGYEKLGFSIVEDYALFTAITNHGFGFFQNYTSEVMSLSEPVNSLAELGLQRRRWMEGVMQSFWLTRLTIILAACLIPFLVLLAFWNPALSGSLLLFHYVAITVTSIISVVVLKQYDLLKTVFFFWFYLFIHTTVMLVNYFRRGPLIWKGREY